MVPLMILLAACDTDTSANDIKLPKSHVAPNVSCLKECNGAIDDAVTMMGY